MVAHELKQPLGAINNYSEAILRQLKRGKKPAEEILTEALSEIKSESQRASEIVEFVRNIGRKELARESALIWSRPLNIR